ncbi:MAG: methyltransferase domain-containing protein [Phycisphaerales bacterium]|nr:methyltransferase domain-containing protein [Phycisphaerales bacterium]
MAAPLDTDATRAHWDDLASGYDAAKARNDVYYGTLKRLLQEAVPDDARGHVLEVGCGTGQLLAALAPTRGLGIDISPGMIDRARARQAPHPELVFDVLDATDAAARGPFDAVVSADVLEHVPDWSAVVDACVDACRPGGTIVLTTPNPLWTLPLWILEKARLKMPEGPHAFVSIRRVAARLRERGCAVRRVGTHAMIPARLLGLGPTVSRLAADLPLLRWAGVIQMVVATRPH